QIALAFHRSELEYDPLQQRRRIAKLQDAAAKLFVVHPPGVAREALASGGDRHGGILAHIAAPMLALDVARRRVEFSIQPDQPKLEGALQAAVAADRRKRGDENGRI